MKRAEFVEKAGQVAAEPPRPCHIKGIGDVHIREMTIGEIDDQIADNADKKNKRGVARGACRLLCEPDGTRMLDPSIEADVDVMAKLPMRVLQAINKAGEGLLEGN